MLVRIGLTRGERMPCSGGRDRPKAEGWTVSLYRTLLSLLVCGSSAQPGRSFTFVPDKKLRFSITWTRPAALGTLAATFRILIALPGEAQSALEKWQERGTGVQRLVMV